VLGGLTIHLLVANFL